MLPNTIKKLIPKVLVDNLNNDGQALIDIIDSYIATWKSEIIGIMEFKDIAKCPAKFLSLWGDYLSAGIQNDDSETEKRIKILYAIQGHNRRSLFTDDIKNRIDNITGLSSSIYSTLGNDEWILVGDGNTPSAYYWSAMGCDGIDTDLGILLIGEGTEPEIAGNIYIEFGGVVGASTVDEVVVEITALVPAYYAVYLGHESGGVFTVQATI